MKMSTKSVLLIYIHICGDVLGNDNDGRKKNETEIRHVIVVVMGMGIMRHPYPIRIEWQFIYS